MSLRIRRGTDAQRQSVQLDIGELAYTTDTQKLYVGDGTVLGGHNILATSAGAGLVFDSITQTLKLSTSVGIASVSADTAPRLGGNLVLNTYDISGTGNILITGTGTFEPSVTATKYSNDNIGGALYGKKARGTSTAPTTIQSGDTLLYLGSQGYTGSSYLIGANIRLVATGTVSPTALQSNIVFTAYTNVGSAVTALSIGGKALNCFVPVLLPNYAGVSSYPSGTAGMIIYDSTANHFFGYNGVAWRQLDN